MSTASVYLLNMPGKSAVTLSQDELRSLLGQIEAELHSSEIYRRIVARLQILLGDAGEQAKVLCKAVGREAIGLAFQQFAQQDSEEDNTEIAANIKPENSSALFNCQTQVALTSETTSINTGVSIATDRESTTNTHNNPVTRLSQWLHPNNKSSKAELAKQMAEQHRLETMRQIGWQLKQARESQYLSVEQLQVYTHISVPQMEAVENANFEFLPEDVCLRGFIRVMGNALGINGTILAASLPTPGTVKSILPSLYQPQKDALNLRLEIRPLHLYLGYTALIAGAVGGLSHLSQPSTTNSLVNSPVPSVSQSLQHQADVTTKPGIKSSADGSISVGNDIAPPEAL
ncbi:helix-turn-helix domain-containing protein [Anabaena sp. UHCC 0399]|uniref:helix-turn-helix domain-containing protein n=1 Tax=Anabaena sp. UHCC 0399 TaxID=3110238 RepID=UPI002B1F0DF6|nr:helix-turn-helix domain-containing protein [Anabaena sp. UHCC 0399]MEA5565316.1 helix-turn-helix domain-containing protein [Anabaena sp. UHCC 0399]